MTLLYRKEKSYGQRAWGKLVILSSLPSGYFTRWLRAWNIYIPSCTLFIATWNITTFSWVFKIQTPWTKRKGNPRSKLLILQLRSSYPMTQTIPQRRLNTRFHRKMVVWPLTPLNNWRTTNSWRSRLMCGRLVSPCSSIGMTIYLKPTKIRMRPAKNSKKLSKKLILTPSSQMNWKIAPTHLKHF